MTRHSAQTKEVNAHNTDRSAKKNFEDIIGAGTKVIWNKKVKDTQIEKFKQVINAKYNVKLVSYWDLHKWSVENYANFWEEIWHFFGVKTSQTYQEVVKKTGDGFMDIEWFSGAKFNYAENILRFKDNHIALICADEDGGEEKITYAQMHERVKLYSAAMKKNGLQMGDRVACYMSNRKEAVFAMLAAASIGAIWGGPLPFYGAKAALNVIKQMSPKFLFTVDRFQFNKIETNLLENLSSIVSKVISLEKVIIVPTKEETFSADLSGINNSCFLKAFLDSGKNTDGSIPEQTFEQLPFNYPICINFTSGTTGLPKGIVHSSGTLLPVMRDCGLHCDCTRDDVILTWHPVGWSLWDTHMVYLAIGSTIVLYDGYPFFLSSTAFWDLMEKYKVSNTFIVTSIVDRMEKSGITPGPKCNLDHLKMITIGASPVKLQNFEFIRNKVKNNLFVGCCYGATEMFGIFSGYDFNTPAYSGEIQAPSLGFDIKCYDEKGKSVLGQRGELVIATPNPAIPIGVWNDMKQKRLQELYFSKYPGVWNQNDECFINPRTKGFMVVGRSDDTLNCNGERYTSTDIYFGIHAVEELEDSLCVGQDNSNGDQRAVLFLKLKNKKKLSSELKNKIRQHISQELTAYHVPEMLLEIQDIPYNLNGKKMERLVKTIIATNTVPDVPNIRNPECLQSFCNIPELQNYGIKPTEVRYHNSEIRAKNT